MARPPHLPPAPSPASPAAPDTFAYRWLFEVAAVWVRWGAVLLCLLLIPLFPRGSPLLVLLLALGISAGNAAIAWLLHQGFSPRRQWRVSWVATGLEWAAALGSIGLLAQVPASNAPAVLLVLVLHTGLRFGWPGVIMAAAGAEVVVGLLVTAQLLLLWVVDVATATREWASWAGLILLMALAVAAFIRAGWTWRQRQDIDWLQNRADQQRLQYRLSPREWELLPWLVREDLTYEQIGALLHVSPETVRSHVGHIGAKLGVSGGRVTVVRAARERGMLPPLPGVPTTEGPGQTIPGETERQPEGDSNPPADARG